MIVALALVLVPCNQVEDIADKQHLTWTMKVLLEVEGSKFQIRPLFTSATHYILNVLSTMNFLLLLHY